MEDKELDRVYSKYKDKVNMTATELLIWSKNPASKLASLDRSPIRRNLRLLRKPKYKWLSYDIDDANKTISFISRMKRVKKEMNSELRARRGRRPYVGTPGGR